MHEAKMNLIYWPEVIKTVAYLKNRTIANTTENKTPFEILFGIKPNVKHLKIYGSRVFVRQPENKRQNKWDDKSVVGVLVGYAKYGYRVLVKGRVFVARHVQVIENATELICLEEIDKEIFEDDNEMELKLNGRNIENSSKIENESIVSENDYRNEDVYRDKNLRKLSQNSSEDEVFTDARAENRLADVNAQNKIRRVSTRDRKKPERYGDLITNCVYVNYVNANVPDTFEEAINAIDSHEWKKAMDSEIRCLNKNETWQVVEKPKDKKIIDVKWVYKRKSDGNYKARLVVRGFQQKDYLENVYSPVGKMQTLKVLLSFCCANNLYVDQMDVETAFLNGAVKSEVYVREPEGYETGVNKVCRLKKALYGLRESSRTWYDCFNNFIEITSLVRLL